MSNRLSPPPPRYQAKTVEAHASRRETRRSHWRQRLVDAERGFVLGFRRDSAFFGYLFGAVVSITAGVVLGLEYVEWIVLLLASTTVLVAELLNHMVQCVVEELAADSPSAARKALRLGTAAVYTAISGTGGALLLMFGRRIYLAMHG